jgi:hypothetical protein
VASFISVNVVSGSLFFHPDDGAVQPRIAEEGIMLEKCLNFYFENDFSLNILEYSVAIFE